MNLLLEVNLFHVISYIHKTVFCVFQRFPYLAPELLSFPFSLSFFPSVSFIFLQEENLTTKLLKYICNLRTFAKVIW